MTVNHVISADGTRIVFDKLGSGPAVLCIGGGPTDRRSEAPLADLLAQHFTVYNMDRRGRGDSGDTEPYAPDREFEDIAAVVQAAGGSVMAYGTSGGAMIALKAAIRGIPLTRLALWEPAFILPGTRTPVPADYRDQQWKAKAEGRFSDMLEMFMVDAVGMPAEMVAGMKAAPFWDSMAAGAACLAYDADIVENFEMPIAALRTVTTPALLVDGATTDWLTATCEQLGEVLPDAKRATLHGQPHNVDATALAPLVIDFLRK